MPMISMMPYLKNCRIKDRSRSLMHLSGLLQRRNISRQILTRYAKSLKYQMVRYTLFLKKVTAKQMLVGRSDIDMQSFQQLLA